MLRDRAGARDASRAVAMGLLPGEASAEQSLAQGQRPSCFTLLSNTHTCSFDVGIAVRILPVDFSQDRKSASPNLFDAQIQASERIVHSPRGSAHEAALYGALSSNVQAVYPVCRDWPDHVWALARR